MRRAAAVLFLAALACARPGLAADPEGVAQFGPDAATTRLLVRGTTDIANFAPVLEAFAKGLPYLGIDYEQWLSNDLSDETARGCREESRAADLVISSAVDQLVKLVNDGCARPYPSTATRALGADANWRDEIFGVTQEPAVIVYNRDLVPPDEAPRSRFALIDLVRPAGSRYAGRVATYDIEASGLGYLFAFVDSEQATTFGSLIEAFGRSGAVATCCSTEIIDGLLRGDYLIAYNVLGSYALARAATDTRLGVVYPEDYTLMLSRAAMIPAEAINPDAAGALIDFLLSGEGRAALDAQHMLTSPAEMGAAASAVRPIRLSPTLLVGLDQERRRQFLDLWRTTFPRR